MRLRIGGHIKNMLGPDIPNEAVFGVGLEGATQEELYILSPKEQREALENYRGLSLNVWTTLISSLLAYLLMRTGKMELTVPLDRLTELTDKVRLVAELDRTKREVYFRAVGKELAGDKEDIG